MTKQEACDLLISQDYNAVVDKGVVTIFLDEDDPRSIEEVFRIKINYLRESGYQASFAVNRKNSKYIMQGDEQKEEDED